MELARPYTPHERGPEPVVSIAFCDMSQNVAKMRLTYVTGCGIFTGCGVRKTWNHRNHILPNRFCCFFCVRLTQPRSLVTGYFNSNLAGVRNISLSPPVSSLHLANSCAIYLHTPLVLVHMPGGNGIGAHHTGGIELRHCDVSPGEVVWERIPEGPLRYCTLHATLVT